LAVSVGRAMNGRSMKETRKRGRALRNITRYDTRRGPGWLVRLKRSGHTRWEWFMDSVCGGRAAARRAAVAWRNRMLLALPPPLRISRRDVRNTTGVVGVHRDQRSDKLKRIHYSYRATWPDPSGKTVRRSFAVKKYGEEQALALATRARRAGPRTLAEAKKGALVRELGPGRAGERQAHPHGSRA
jgi:hypothetical protein